MSPPSVPLGVTFASFQSLGLDAALTAARWADELGYRSYWTAETMGPEAFATLGAVVGDRALARPRHGRARVAAPHASARGDGGRHAPGAAARPRRAAGRRHLVAGRHEPMARRAVRRRDRSPRFASTSSWSGSACRVTPSRSKATSTTYVASGLGVRLGDRKPKIVIGALNEHMLALAGEIADGVLLNYLPASLVPWSVEQVRRGGDATIYAYVHVGVCERDGRHRLRPSGPVLVCRRRLVRAQLRTGGLRRRGRGDPREAPGEGPRRRGRGGVGPHGRRHRHHGRRRPRHRERPRLRRRRCRCAGRDAAAMGPRSPRRVVRSTMEAAARA